MKTTEAPADLSNLQALLTRADPFCFVNPRLPHCERSN
jgi:hypothetical protein